MDAYQQAFDKLKASLISRHSLMAPNFNKEFVLKTDVLDHGLEAMLLQQGPDSQLHAVLYLSQRLSACEQGWSVSEKECHSTIFSTNKPCPYL